MKIHRIFQILQTILIISLTSLSFITNAANYDSHPNLSGGEGTQDSPYQISTSEDLKSLSFFINKKPNLNPDLFPICYELTDDIDMQGIEFFPIRDNNDENHTYIFNFDGKGHTIKNLSISKESQYPSFFGYLENERYDNIYIKNIHIKEVTAEINKSSYVYAGGLFAFTSQKTENFTIDNCSVSGSFSILSFDYLCVGGICGEAKASKRGLITISNCKNNINIKVNDKSIDRPDDIAIGGIVGRSRYCNIKNCSNYANIEGSSVIGGIAGFLEFSNANKCNNSGRITFFDNYAGGIAGRVYSSAIDFCCNIGAVTLFFKNEGEKLNCNSKYIGGIAGLDQVHSSVYQTSFLGDNLNAGYISGWDYTGGICGYPQCYTYNNINIAPVFDAKPYINNCKSGANNATYPFGDESTRNDFYGGALYDKQMSLLTDSMHNKVFEEYDESNNNYFHKVVKIAELYTNQLLNDSIYKYFSNRNEINGPHDNEYQWIHGQDLYPVPNETDSNFNVLASLVLTLNADDRADNVNHQFQIVTQHVDDNHLRIESASNNKICKVSGNSIGLVALGKDTLRIYYKDLLREIPLTINAVDTLMFSGGTGTEKNPYLISCLKDLKELEYKVDRHTLDTDKNWSFDKYFKVTTHIDSAFSGSIGDSENPIKAFQGYFDGNGKRITIDRKRNNINCALFNYATEPCIIKNLEVNGNIEFCKTGAGIITYAENVTIDSCLNTVNIVASDTAGGIIAIAKNCRISNCGNNGLIKSGKLSGGLVGYCQKSIVKDIVNGGAVLSKNTAGGLIGSMPNTELNTGLNYGYTGRTTAEISNTRIGYIVGELNSGTEKNTYWNIQTNTIWNSNWETEGLSTNQMLTDKTLKDKLGKNWETSSETTLAIPKALKKFPGTILLNLPFSFTNEWNTLKDINEPFKYPAETFILDNNGTDLALHAGDNATAKIDGTITPVKFGTDTLEITYYYKGWRNTEFCYRKIVPYFSSKGFLGNAKGTEDDPYLINNENDLNKMIEAVNNDFFCVDTIRNASWNKYFKQINDIDYTITSPIGNSKQERYNWNGHYDGNGHYLKLNIESSDNFTGLFSVLSKNASVKNLSIKGKVTGTDHCGAFAGIIKNNCEITNCHNYALIEGKNNIGGIIGTNAGGLLSQSTNAFKVYGIENVGGICGYSDNMSQNIDLLNIGHISGFRNIGGIIGVTDSCGIHRSINAGLTEGKENIGGITGLYLWNNENGILIYQCLNYGYVAKDAKNTGAIVGKNEINAGVNVNLCFYNNQMSLTKGINNTDNIGFCEGYKTNDLIGDKLSATLGHEWNYSPNNYPIPNNLQGDEVVVACNPTLIADDENYIRIGTEFDFYSEDELEWNSKLGKFSINNNKIQFIKSGVDTLITTKNNVYKEQPIFIINGLFSGGNGKKEHPFRITCKHDFDDLATYVNSNMLETNEDRNWSDDLFFSLENDIPEDSAISITIGKPDTKTNTKIHFGGIFNGHGHKLKLNINETEINTGLFGYLNKATIDSLYIYGSVTGASNVGGFAGYSENSTISNCQNAATITGNNDAGGICGYISSTNITNCNNAGEVQSEENKAGGIVAEAYDANISNCVNIAKISSFTNNSFSGGICGLISNKSTINSCLNGGIIIGENKVGGIVGEANTSSVISNCIVTNDIDNYIRATIIHKGYICGLLDDDAKLKTCFVDTQLNSINDAKDSEIVNKRLTKSLSGFTLQDSLPNDWIFEANRYPRPNNDTIALLGSSAFFLKSEETKENIKDNFEVFTFENSQWGTIVPRINVKNGIANLSSLGEDTLIVSHEILKKKIHINIECITNHINDTIIGCNSVFHNNKTYNESTSIVDTLTNITGCDSIIKTIIIVNKATKAPAQPIIYTTKDTTINGVKCTKDTTITYTINNSAGCDSIITQEINIIHTKKEDINIPFECDSSLYNNKWYKTDTIIKETYKDEHGRDTLIKNIYIHVGHTLYTVFDTVRGYDSVLYNGIWYKETTLVTDSTLQDGSICYAIKQTPIYVGKSHSETVTKTFCGEVIQYISLHDGKKIEVKNGDIVFDTLIANNDLLNIKKYVIDIRQPKDTTIYINGCDSVFFNENVYTKNDTITKVIPSNSDLCDSTVHYVLNVIKPSINNIVINGCNFVDYNSIIFTKSTTLYDTLKHASYLGCDSIIATHININKAPSDTLHTYGLEEKIVYGVKYTNDTILVDTLVNIAGCDSFLYTYVHITHFKSDTVKEFACDSFYHEGIWLKTDFLFKVQMNDPFKQWDDLEQKYQTFQSTQKWVNVIIGKKQYFEKNIDGCDFIEFRGKVYTENEIVSDTFQTKRGCDSIVNYHLTIHKAESKDIVITGCEEVTWKDEIYKKSATFVEYGTTIWGCDSVTNIIIEVSHPDTAKPEIITGCGLVDYEGESYKEDTTITRVLTNKGGCDSIITTHIIVYQPSETLITLEGEYDVYYNGRKFTRSTVFRDTLVNQYKCDSIVTVAIIITKGLEYPIIVNKYNYMLLCNNNIGNDKYTSYQWYKNGKAISGETKAYMSEAEGNQLSGCYQVYVKTTTGDEYFSEETCIDKAKELFIYPNPVNIGEIVTIDYEFSEKEKNGLYYDIYNSTGMKVYSDTPTGFPIEIPGLQKKGYYFVLITTGEDKNLSTKFIVK